VNCRKKTFLLLPFLLKGMQLFGDDWELVHHLVRKSKTVSQVQDYGESFQERQKQIVEGSVDNVDIMDVRIFSSCFDCVL
jgi:hypothetical protein